MGRLKPVLAALLALALAAGAADPTAESPAPSPAVAAAPAPPAIPAAAPQRFALDLYRPGDFVGQYTFEWCVGASIQMMLNMVRPRNERARARQEGLWELARDLSTNPRRGANPVGWTAALNELGIGTWELVGVPDYEEALRTAAAAIRASGRPVGLVMWSGRHAWVMSGFTSIGDPRSHPDFVVTGVRVLDPLYPSGDGVWGPSPRPDALLAPTQLDDNFVPRRRRRADPNGRPDYVPAGSYVLILPVPARATASRAGEPAFD